MPLLLWRRDVLGQHPVDECFERGQAGRRAFRNLPRQRFRAEQRRPDHFPGNPVALRELPNRQSVDSGVAPDPYVSGGGFSS